MKKAMILSFCLMFVLSSLTATFANTSSSFCNSIKTTDMPDYPDNDNGGPYTDPDTSDDSGPDSTDSGDSWDSGSDGFSDPDGSGSGVLF